MSYYDTQGRYTELENLTNSINQNAVTTGIFVNENETTVFFDDPLNVDREILDVYKLYRSENIVIVSTGIRGDSKYLLSVIKGYIEDWKSNFDDYVTGAYLSRILADFIHTYTLRRSMRPLGTIIMVADSLTNHVYKIGVDSAYDRANLFVVGKNSVKIESRLRTANINSHEELNQALDKVKDELALTNLRIFKFEKWTPPHERTERTSH